MIMPGFANAAGNLAGHTYTQPARKTATNEAGGHADGWESRRTGGKAGGLAGKWEEGASSRAGKQASGHAGHAEKTPAKWQDVSLKRRDRRLSKLAVVSASFSIFVLLSLAALSHFILPFIVSTLTAAASVAESTNASSGERPGG